MTYKEQLQQIANRYAASGEAWPATAREIAAWAIRKGLWQPQRASLVRRCADELTAAMREEYMRDPQGRIVRVKHAALMSDDGPRQMKWADIRTATREHMAVAFSLRRQHILGECRQLKTDVDSYNENGAVAEPIQLVLDFTEDVAEMEAISRVRGHASTGRALPWRRSPSAPPPTA